MPSDKDTCANQTRKSITEADSSVDGNPRLLKALAYEKEAEAALLRAKAERAQAAIEAAFVRPKSDVAGAGLVADLDERAAARVVNVNRATFRRAGIQADYFAGDRPRWRNAESVREKFAARGRKPTTPAPKAASAKTTDHVDVDASLSAAGLRLVSGRR